MIHKKHRASLTPGQAIEAVAYPGQPQKRKMYHSGYEEFMNELYILTDGDQFLADKMRKNKKVIEFLAEGLKNEGWLVNNPPAPKDFHRTIIGIEDSINGVAGSELVVASWGDGFSSPVHGHAPGFILENILFGMLRVNTYRQVSPDSEFVRPAETSIITRGTFLSTYAKKDDASLFARKEYIHNFTSLGFSASLHYLPEHTRDGRDNTFKVEHFEDTFELQVKHFKKVNPDDYMNAPVGSVFLVRSDNVAEYGDHWIIVTGPPVVKPHGFRPQEMAIQTNARGSKILDNWLGNLTLLKLNDEFTEGFLSFHNFGGLYDAD